MRLEHHGMEIQLHQTQSAWLWVVFDEDGEQICAGQKPDQRTALGAARRSADWRGGLIETGIRSLRSVSKTVTLRRT
jgi:hypothetical protein